ncbi:NAD(P)/FAD-dependent oxidoreductase [bacterium]|nr:NAD(P)/FAD-dependent oxidoreductase [bacterium]
MNHVVIIGNGISGISTARHIRKKSEARITVISSESEHFFSRTALMYIYMGHMKYEHTKPYEDWFWKKNRIDLVYNHVESVDFESKTLKMALGNALHYDTLVIATGSVPNKFEWPGQNLQGVQGLYSKQDLELMEQNSKNLKQAVVVGGGLIGIEMAEMLHSRNIHVTFLVRENSFWNSVLPAEESEMINKHIQSQHIDLRLGEELAEIVDDGSGKVAGIITKTGEKIDCGFVGLTVGVSPNIAFLKNTALDIDHGILINERQETNLPDVYAVGDCAQHRIPPTGRKAIEQIWYTGKLQGENCANNICGKQSSYQPGVFYNSAKFFDIEYQTYGNVAVPEPTGIASVFWQHNSGLQSIRVAYEIESRAVIGFNLLGIRYRHEVCEQWIRKRIPIEKVLKNLKKANFDPEFHKKYEHEVAQIFTAQIGTNKV